MDNKQKLGNIIFGERMAHSTMGWAVTITNGHSSLKVFK